MIPPQHQYDESGHHLISSSFIIQTPDLSPSIHSRPTHRVKRKSLVLHFAHTTPHHVTDSQHTQIIDHEMIHKQARYKLNKIR